MKILLIEDNNTVRSSLTYLLKENNYKVIEASNYKEARQKLIELPDFIILDISLPDGNGLDLYKEHIKELNIPTIFLTAKDDEETIVKGLTIGAEDYITKPFSSKELLIRISKILMRQEKNTIIEVKNIKFDIDKMEVYKSDKKVDLTSLEIKILSLLFTSLNKVVTRNYIMDKIWEWTGNDVEDNTVTVYLKRIREKLDTDIILTIKGIGYRIDNNEK